MSELLKDLNQAQKEAVSHQKGPLLMAAGAGSGKTRALTHRLKWLIEQGTAPQKILAITFTNKAADQMRTRVFGKNAEKPAWNTPLGGGHLPFIGTFHSLGARILKNEFASFGRAANFTIFDDDASLSLIKKICKNFDLAKERFRPPVLEAYVSDLKSELKNPDEVSKDADSWETTALAVFDAYETELKKNNAFDFDDLIEKPVRLFLEKLEILKKYQALFGQILVDEYQDINTAQYRLIRLLAGEHKNISVVGDDAQAIYSFRGADFRNFLNFERDWPEAKVVFLDQNYRSTKTIIAAASAVIKQNKIQKPKNLWTDNSDGEPIKIIAAEDPDTESVWVAAEIASIRTAAPEAEIAVIYRTNAQSRSIEQALLAENLPYKVFGGPKFYDRKEIKDIIAALKLIQNPNDSVSAERLVKTFGKRGGEALIKGILDLQPKTEPAKLIDLVLIKSQYKDYLAEKTNNPQERLENVIELVSFAGQFPTLEEFLERVSLLQSTDLPSGGSEKKNKKGEPVSLMTIHLAKGLEFDYVFVLGCNEGILPHEKSMTTPDEVEEERRLMYVAMTRAKKQLYLSFHLFPSRFLYEIPTDLTKFISPTGNFRELPSEDDMYIEN